MLRILSISFLLPDGREKSIRTHACMGESIRTRLVRANGANGLKVGNNIVIMNHLNAMLAGVHNILVCETVQ